MMVRTAPLIASLLIFLLTARTSLAEGFSASVEISTGSQKQSATSETTPRKDKPLSARPKLEAPADAEFTVRWKVTRTSPETVKDVLVHFYVVQIERPGQAPPPLAPNIVQLESALNMDFESKTSSSAQMGFRPQKPGVYLVRIEAEQTYAEMDLVAK